MDWDKFKNIFNRCELDGDKIVITSDLVETLSFIKDNYGFNLFKEITAVDKKEDGIELIYHVYSTEDEEDLLLSITVKDEVESITGIFDAAHADEKEIYDMFGIKFIGNEELKRLYMPENWEGHPLKKDYKEEDQRLNWNE